MHSYSGFLMIGDPHIASRNPGFRKDDYPEAILAKLSFLLRYAKEENLQPIILGDLFHFPRDNSNWLITNLINLFKGHKVYGIVGNHDIAERKRQVDDSISILEAAGALVLLEGRGETFLLGDEQISIGGSSWGMDLPDEVKSEADFVIWCVHHDVRFPGYPMGTIDIIEIKGVDMVVNGHIHHPLPEVKRGGTRWLNPGNISRVKRGDATREMKPRALEIRVNSRNRSLESRFVEVPHGAFEEVFHLDTEPDSVNFERSGFIQGLEQLTSIKTEDGSGLREFLEKNLDDFPSEIAESIRELAKEVCDGS